MLIFKDKNEFFKALPLICDGVFYTKTSTILPTKVVVLSYVSSNY
ncbi:hypothetical protein GMMP1_860018 [Candidatus Magnetomoraceae bacterium gMMP-1]